MTHARSRVRIAAIAVTVVSALLLVCAAAPAAPPAKAAAEPFGPIESRSFTIKPGTTIEAVKADCHWNNDYLFIKGANVANAKSIDVSGQVWSRFMSGSSGVPTTECVAPNCAQLYIGINGKQAPGPRTVTVKHSDGRTLTTTFDVIANAGRCDTP